MLVQECISRCRTSAPDYSRIKAQSVLRDYEKVVRRVENEGLSFFTITLPSFGKDFERGLADGGITPTSFMGFKRSEPTEGQGLPAFLRGFLELVFHPDSGVLLEEPNLDAIRSVRQLTLMFGKMLVPCSDARVRAAKRGYLKCEQDVRINTALLSPDDQDDFLRMAEMLFGEALADVDDIVWVRENVFPHMGQAQLPTS